MSDKRESDRLLELAERQFERVTKLEREAYVSKIAVVCCVVSWVGAALVGMLPTLQSLQISRPLMLVVMLLAAVGMGWFGVSLRNLLNLRRVEESVLNEALSLVQESEKYLADKEQWTLLERAEFRLRLRRLPVGIAPPAASATASPTPTPASTRPPTAV